VSRRGVNSNAESPIMGCLFIILCIIILGPVLLVILNLLPG
jgi:hypothetical protein